MDLLSNIMISEIIAFGCSSVGVAMGTNDLAATPILMRGSEEIKKKFLTRLTAEPLMAVSIFEAIVGYKCGSFQSFACTEPSAGSDISQIRTKAEKKGTPESCFTHHY